MAEANVSDEFFISPGRNIAFYIVDVKAFLACRSAPWLVAVRPHTTGLTQARRKDTKHRSKLLVAAS
jgi:hypothetical protein